MAGVLQVAAAVIRGADGRVLIARRPNDVHQGGFWEFPGGKLEPGESVEQALIRELDEELGIRPTSYRRLIRIPHRYPDRNVLLDVWHVDAFDGTPAGRQGQPLKWVRAEDLPSYAFPAANRPIVAAARLPDRYLISPDPGARPRFREELIAALDRGIRLVQLRATDLSQADYSAVARDAIEICHSFGAQILLNAAPDLAVDLGADGIHLSARRSLAATQRPLPPELWCAASCHTAEELAHAAAIGLDFAVLSPVNRTQSHPGAEALGWSRFGELVWDAPLPVYALGGVGPDDLNRTVQARGQGIAAIRGLWY